MSVCAMEKSANTERCPVKQTAVSKCIRIYIYTKRSLKNKTTLQMSYYLCTEVSGIFRSCDAIFGGTDLSVATDFIAFDL